MNRKKFIVKWLIINNLFLIIVYMYVLLLWLYKKIKYVLMSWFLGVREFCWGGEFIIIFRGEEIIISFVVEIDEIIEWGFIFLNLLFLKKDRND